MCVCLLILHRVSGGKTEMVRDKCHQMVPSSDQPFCDDCEDAEHHLADNQLGLNNIVKESE